MEEDIKNKEWKEALLKHTNLDSSWISAKFEKDFPGLTHKLIKNYSDKIYNDRTNTRYN